MSKLVLVTGGARSGKSSFAERYVLASAKKVDYIATAEILDDEMAERVRLHQMRRANGRWVNHEGYYDARDLFATLGAETEAVLFDCLTLYVTNYLYGKKAIRGSFEERSGYVLNEISGLVKAARKSGKIVVFVTNEVGAGIVPENVMAREFRDVSGWANQLVAEAADEVYLCTCGYAVDVKKLGVKI